MILPYIRGINSTIYCTEKGSGLVFEHVSNLKVLNVTFKGCGTLSANGKHLSAVHIFNSINIHFEETKFQMSHGRGLSMFEALKLNKVPS